MSLSVCVCVCVCACVRASEGGGGAVSCPSLLLSTLELSQGGQKKPPTLPSPGYLGPSCSLQWRLPRKGIAVTHPRMRGHVLPVLQLILLPVCCTAT